MAEQSKQQGLQVPLWDSSSVKRLKKVQFVLRKTLPFTSRTRLVLSPQARCMRSNCPHGRKDCVVQGQHSHSLREGRGKNHPRVDSEQVQSPGRKHRCQGPVLFTLRMQQHKCLPSLGHRLLQSDEQRWLRRPSQDIPNLKLCLSQ